jgi:hypothetical protein
MGGEELLPRQFGYLDSADLDKLPTFVAPGRGATRTVSSCTRNDAQADPGKRSRRAANAIRSAGVHLSRFIRRSSTCTWRRSANTSAWSFVWSRWLVAIGSRGIRRNE